MMKTAPSRFLVGLLALGGCDGFALVEPSGNEQPLLSVSINAVNDESLRYELNAFFRRGTDARGRPTELADRALYVEGRPVLPDPETQPGIWSYRWQETRATTGAQADSLRLTFPVVAGSSSGPFSIMIPVARRADPRDIALIRGEDLLLRVSPAAGATAELSGRVDQWTLEIRQACSGSNAAPQFVVTGTRAYPSELRVPWQWLETHAVDSFSACFRAFSSFEVIGSPYSAFVTVIVQLAWQIRVVEPGA